LDHEFGSKRLRLELRPQLSENHYVLTSFKNVTFRDLALAPEPDLGSEPAFRNQISRWLLYLLDVFKLNIRHDPDPRFGSEKGYVQKKTKKIFLAVASLKASSPMIRKWNRVELVSGGCSYSRTTSLVLEFLDADWDHGSGVDPVNLIRRPLYVQLNFCRFLVPEPEVMGWS